MGREETPAARRLPARPLLALSVSVVALLTLSTVATAAPASRYSTVVTGNLTSTGNTLGLSASSVIDGPGNQDGIGTFTDATFTLAEPGWPMGTTRDWQQNSSDATLAVPTGATVVYAELFWGGSFEGNDVHGTSLATLVETPIAFTTPDNVQHTIVPDVTSATPLTGPIGSNNYYIRSNSIEVTAIVAALGAGASGVYRVGGVPASQFDLGAGSDPVNHGAGWTLVVAYELATEPLRSLDVFMLDAYISPLTNPVDATFQLTMSCPPTTAANVDAKVLVTALEGDAGRLNDTLRLASDQVSLNNAAARLSGPNNAAGNFFGSHINDSDGVLDTSGTWGNNNHGLSNYNVGARQGWDITTVDGSAQLNPGDADVWLEATSANDQYVVAVLGISNRLEQADFATAPSSGAVSQPVAQPGETVTFSVVLHNTGDAAAIAPTLSLPASAFPPGVSYVANSVLFNGFPPAGGPIADTTSLTSGLVLPDLAPSASISVSWQVEVLDIPPNAEIVAAPVWNYSWSHCAGGQFTRQAKADALRVDIFDCGNGTVEPVEGCDDGDTTAGNGCDDSCEPEYGYTCNLTGGVGSCEAMCGDGMLAAGAEACDDGNEDAEDGCSEQCVVEFGYQCGTLKGTDAPDSSCVSDCGDMEVAVGAEECDDGNAISGDGCDSCVQERGYACGAGGCVSDCGDGVIAVGEEVCDDGNTVSQDGCSDTCGREPGFVCSDSSIDTDEDPDTICLSTCGDKQLAVGPEECDDGNTDAGDGCDANCLREPGFVCTEDPGMQTTCEDTCGDGLMVGGEACDDGNLVSGDGCTDNCEIEPGWSCPIAGEDCEAGCGDGLVVGNEQCDDGNDVANDGCANCVEEDGWSCDEPSPTAASSCDSTCGDGLIAAGEEACDDNNTVDGDGCSAGCTVEPGFSCDGEPSACVAACSDGVINGAETCDDGNTVDGDGCSSTCEVEDGFLCNGAPSSCGADSDGDGVLDDGDGSGTAGDNPCSGGDTVGCDDNCVDTPNSDQEDVDEDAVGDACKPVFDGPKIEGGGGGCTTSGGSGSGPWLWLIGFALSAVALRRRSQVASLAVLFGVAALSTSDTRAQDVDPRNFDATLAPTGILSVDTTAGLGDLSVFAGLFANFANDELVERVDADGETHGPLRNRWRLTAAIGLGLFDRVDIGVALPYHVTEVTDTSGGPTSDDGLADLRVFVKGRILGAPLSGSGFGLAVAVDATFPTGDAGPHMKESALTLTPRAVVDYRFDGGAVVALNVGYRIRETQTILDLAVGHEVRAALGAELPLPFYGFALVGEVVGAVGLGESDVDTFGTDARKVPVEALGGLKWRTQSGLTLTAAAGTGLTRGYGAPDYRFFFGLTYGAAVPEPWEEPLVDGAPDVVEFNESPPFGAVPTMNAASFDAAAKNDPDPDGDGVEGETDLCPDVPEDIDNFKDDDGCPEPDNDEDGVPDELDKCPTEKEVINGNNDTDGCPDEGEALVVAGADKIEIAEKIEFNTGGSQIAGKSKRLLNAVAQIIKANPQIPRFRIEGHTDDTGDPEMNVMLSVSRADAVRRYLIQNGKLSPDKLMVIGFGPLRPIADNKTKQGRAINRRVEFFSMTWDEIKKIQAEQDRLQEEAATQKPQGGGQ